MTGGFVHAFEPGGTGAGAGRVLLLLHGTGGDERDLLPLGRALLPGAALLSPRGKVLERGMPRFFRRLAEGVFDEADLRARAHELADFVGAARADHGLGEAPVTAVGFSNGANVAAAVLLLRPGVLGGAVLLRPMVPFEADVAPARPGHARALLLAGASDPIAPPAHAGRLAVLLRGGGAEVELRTVPAGHGLVAEDLEIARAWLGAPATQPG